ncbi:hypothetical protein [Mitsuaria sp. 7]|uniref:hypothetical protein n=1 Tax=Mitsuaria sp. 7 TaxID=1658665 RepID=UPI0007DD78CC|nr:hypothetical protein [Mitsuaria sp. 7]ANH67998.1 hypothetical protein ABE85_11230 [Mitsuaria sp. 7]
MALDDLSPPQRALAEFMSDLSERAYAAGWLADIEIELWRALHSPAYRGGRLRLSLEDVHALESLSTACGGWIFFDGELEETFVPMEEWIVKHPISSIPGR